MPASAQIQPDVFVLDTSALLRLYPTGLPWRCLAVGSRSLLYGMRFGALETGASPAAQLG